MIGILPFVIIFVLCVAAVFVWSLYRTIEVVKTGASLPNGIMIILISAMAAIALIIRITIALTIGLSHSRDPFGYTKLYGIISVVVIFILPVIALFVYQRKTKLKK